MRRAWLCGIDPLTGKDYEYRRQWIRETEQAFVALFAVEVGFRVEMGNHLHMVIRNRPDLVATWSDEEVVRRIRQAVAKKPAWCANGLVRNTTTGIN